MQHDDIWLNELKVMIMENTPSEDEGTRMLEVITPPLLAYAEHMANWQKMCDRLPVTGDSVIILTPVGENEAKLSLHVWSDEQILTDTINAETDNRLWRSLNLPEAKTA